MTRLSRRHGFSTIEALVALSLFTIAAAGLAGTSINAARGTASSRLFTAASALVQDKIEALRALDASANPGDLNSGTHSDSANPLTELGQPGGLFTRVWTVSPGVPVAGVSRVVVTVSWQFKSTFVVTGVTYLCASPTCT